MLESLLAELTDELRHLDEDHRLRTCAALAGSSRTTPEVGGRSLVSFCSNDYLGLASHPALALAASQAATASGYGSSASRLVSGDFPEHRALEASLAGLVDLPAALLFPSGYQANIGLLTSLASHQDLILSDAANHASIIDGCRLSRAKVAVYPHRDVVALRAALADTAHTFRRRIIVTESLFSMDGDIAPLGDIAELASEHHAALLVDEAHALGVFGPAGAGLCRKAGVKPDALVGTLGKSFAALGGFVAASASLCRVLVNRARTFIFTTATPPPVAAAAHAAVTIAASAEGDERRRTLFNRIEQLRASFPAPVLTPIIPYILRDDRAALAASDLLRARGFFVQAIRPPTVPVGTSRLRITLSANHQSSDVDGLTTVLRELAR